MNQKTKVRGVELAWSSTGSGALVVSAHGLGSDRLSLEQTGAFSWEPVARQRRLVRYDARGHGASTGHANPAEYAWSELARDFLVLCDQLEPSAPVDGIGLSMGTATLLHAALLKPERFRRIVLSAPPTAWATRAAQAKLYEDSAVLVEQKGVAAFDRMAALAPTVPVFARAKNFPVNTRVSEALFPSVMRGAALSNLPPPEELARIKVPVLILPWADDPGHPLATVEVLAKVLPNARVEVARTPDDIARWGALAAEFLGDS